MTLLINEIHVHDNLRNSFILLAADQRITVKGKFHSNRKKLYRIPYLNAGVGYFGLAQLNHREFFSSWLPNFTRSVAQTKSLAEYSQLLCDRLNREVNKVWLQKAPSGFHICGYNSNLHPEFWFVRNIYSQDDNTYKEFHPNYFVSEDFLSRDVKQMAGYTEEDPSFSGSYVHYYVNGDIRPFHSIWRQIDPFIAQMLNEKDFILPTRVEELTQIATWKMQVISSFYKKFAKAQIIGSPIDSFVLLPNYDN